MDTPPRLLDPQPKCPKKMTFAIWRKLIHIYNVKSKSRQKGAQKISDFSNQTRNLSCCVRQALRR